MGKKYIRFKLGQRLCSPTTVSTLYGINLIININTCCIYIPCNAVQNNENKNKTFLYVMLNWVCSLKSKIHKVENIKKLQNLLNVSLKKKN